MAPGGDEVEKITKVRTHELVVEALKDYIRTNGLKKGDKLPSAAEIMKALGVGRSSLREALRYLEAVDMIEVINGKGIYVKEPFHYQMSAKINVEDEKKTLLELLEVRRALEELAVELAALRATEEDLAEMKHYLLQIRQSHGKNRNVSTLADMKFHQSIYKASKNQVLQTIVQSVWELLSIFWSSPLGRKEIFDDSMPYHETLFQAIAARDPDRARIELGKLMDNMEESIRQGQNVS